MTGKLLGLILFIIILDQFSKIVSLKLGIPIAFNTGISFGLFSYLGQGVIVLNVVIIFILLYLLVRSKNGSLWFKIGISLLLSGSVSNLIDRLARGSVVDFIKLPLLNFWPLFNVADAAITLGIGLIILSDVITSKSQTA